MSNNLFAHEEDDENHYGFRKNPKQEAAQKRQKQMEVAKAAFELYTWPGIVKKMQAGKALGYYDTYDVRMYGTYKQLQEVEGYKKTLAALKVEDASKTEEQKNSESSVVVASDILVTEEKSKEQNLFIAPVIVTGEVAEPLPPWAIAEAEEETKNQKDIEPDDNVIEIIPEPTDPLAAERSKIIPKFSLTAEQKALFNWDTVRIQFAQANKPVGVDELSWKELDRWIRIALKNGWKQGDEIPLLRTVRYLGDKDGIPRYSALNYNYAFGYARKNSPVGKFWYVYNVTGYEAKNWSGTQLSSQEAGQNYALNKNTKIDFKALSDFAGNEAAGYYQEIIALNGQYKAQLYSQAFVNLVYLVQMRLFPKPEESSKRTGIYNAETHQKFLNYDVDQLKQKKDLEQKLKAEELRWATVGEADGGKYRKYIIEGRTLRVNQEELEKFRAISAKDFTDADEFFEDYHPPTKQEKEDLAFMLTFTERTNVLAAYANELNVDKDEEDVVNLILRNTPKSQQEKMGVFLKVTNRYTDYASWFDHDQQISEFNTNNENLTGEVNTEAVKEAYINIDLTDNAEDSAEDLNEELPSLSPGQIKAFSWDQRKDLLDIFLQKSGPTDAEDWNYFSKLFCNTPDEQISDLRFYLGPAADSNYTKLARLRERTPENQKQQINDSLNSWYAKEETEYYFLKGLSNGNNFKFSYTKAELRLYGLPEISFTRLTDDEKHSIYWFVIHYGTDVNTKHEYAIGILERILSTVGSGFNDVNERNAARQAFYDRLNNSTDIGFSVTHLLANTDEKRETIDRSLGSLDERGRKQRIEEVHSQMGTPESGITDSADDKIARLSDEDMQALGILQRFNMIRAMLGGEGWGRTFTRVGERDEKTLVRLVATTPPEQMGALILLLTTDKGELYEQLVHAIDGDQYKALHDTLLSKKQEQITSISNPEQQAAEQRKVQEMQDNGQTSTEALPWDDYSFVGLVFGGTGYEYEVSWTEDNKVNVVYSDRNFIDGWTTAYSSMGRKIAGMETQRGPYNPWENIAVYAVEDDEELGLFKGQVLVMPAINLFYFQHKQLKGHLLEAVDIITMLVGIGEIKAAVSVGRWLMAAADIIISTGNIATRTFGHTMPDGWVASWHSISGELISFQFLYLGVVGIANYRAIVGGLKQAIPALVAGAKNTVQLAALKMIELCEQLLDFAERILVSFDAAWLNKLLADLDASKLAQKGSVAYTNLSKAIKDRLAVLKEKVAFTSKTDTPVPFTEGQLSYSQSGTVEYLQVDLGGGAWVKLKREGDGDWVIARSSGKTKLSDAEILGKVPGRYKGTKEKHANDKSEPVKKSKNDINRELNKITPKTVDEIKHLLKTEKDTAFFWSGKTEGVGGEKVALNIAETRGGVTLEGLLAKRNIELPAWNPNNPEITALWENVSAEYALQVSGEVRAIIGKQRRTGNIWETKELPALMDNLNVSKITTIDPVTLQETVIFVR